MGIPAIRSGLLGRFMVVLEFFVVVVRVLGVGQCPTARFSEPILGTPPGTDWALECIMKLCISWSIFGVFS